MQQIERYGVIALVFLLVTIVAVSFWGDSKSPGFWSRLTGRGVQKKAELAVAAPRATSDRALDGALPLSPVSNGATAPAELAQPDSGTAMQAVPVDAGTHLSGAAARFDPTDAGASAPRTVGANLPGTTIPSDVERAPAPLGVPPREPPASGWPQAAAASGDYVVRKGDNLALIATRTLGDANRWREIASLNGGLDPKRLMVGQKIKLPGGFPSGRSATLAQPSAPQIEKPSSKPAQKPTSNPAKHGAPAVKAKQGYLVRRGDTLRSIAEKKLGDAGRWHEIVALNPGLEPSRLAVGRSLQLPAGESRPVVASAEPTRQAALVEKPYVR